MVVRETHNIKMKDAAKKRREKERAEFIELSKLLPLPSATTSQLDKASVIRLTSSYLRMRSAFPQGLGVIWGKDKGRKLGVNSNNEDPTFTPQHKWSVQVRELGSLILQTLDGFVFALQRDGKIMYISETASVHLGLPQIDLTGSSVFEFVHPSDHKDLREVLSLSDDDRRSCSQFSGDNSNHEISRSFCMRMKCILPKRNAGLTNGGYKAIHCNGYLKVKATRHLVAEQKDAGCDKQSGSNEKQISDWESYALVAVGHSLLPTASTEIKMSADSFMFRANLDLKLYYIEPQMSKILGFSPMEMIGLSLYQFIHVGDMLSVEKSHRSLLEKGQVVTKYYRLMKRDGGLIWVQSYAMLVNNPRNMPKANHIVSICSILAEDQLDKSMVRFGGDRETSVNVIKHPEVEDFCAGINSDEGETKKKDIHLPEVMKSSSHHEQQLMRRSVIAKIEEHRSNRKEKCGLDKKRRQVRGKMKTIAASSKLEVSRSLMVQPYLSAHIDGACCLVCHKSKLLCSCLSTIPIATNQVVSLPAAKPLQISIGPTRRSSDDTCSVVSSVASNSNSSNASSSTHSSSMQLYSFYDSFNASGYSSGDNSHYQELASNRSDMTPTQTTYLFEQAPVCGTVLTSINAQPFNYDNHQVGGGRCGCRDNQPQPSVDFDKPQVWVGGGSFLGDKSPCTIQLDNHTTSNEVTLMNTDPSASLMYFESSSPPTSSALGQVNHHYPNWSHHQPQQQSTLSGTSTTTAIGHYHLQGFDISMASSATCQVDSSPFYQHQYPINSAYKMSSI